MVGESVLIVASILLAFGIDAWWDGLQENRQRIELLQSLRNDFRTTGGLLEEALERGRLVSARADEFVALPCDPSISQDSAEVLAMGLSTEIPFQPALANYENAVATGDIRLIDSDSLRIYLSRFEDGLRRYEKEDQISAQLFYLGSYRELVRDYGGVRAFRARDDLPALRCEPRVRGSADASATAVRNVLRSLERMEAAGDDVLRELDRLLDEDPAGSAF
jgi:hypothetical protein